MHDWIETQDSYGRSIADTHAPASDHVAGAPVGATQDPAEISDGAQYVVHARVCATCKELLRGLRLSLVHERSLPTNWRAVQ